MADESGAINKNTSNTNYGAIENEGGPSTQQVHGVHINTSGWSFIKYKFRKPFAEFLGTFTLVTFGIGSIAQTGGHLNPAVTITLAVYRNFPWLEVPVYILAQTAGAFVAAFVVYLNYHAALANFDGGNRIVTGANATAGIFATYPAPFMGTLGSFFSEALGTFFLLLVILSVTDSHRYETGFALNGARDFGPRLFTFLVGYGVEVFTASKFYFWIPLVAPVVGGLSAGFVYDSLIYWGKSPLNSN
ncbi:12627_t:CDS:2 [Acaulospora morrowiae]|uniref:12627_t:CDS:1 n=1 Tax=Acaulospora morrowiae TaxID=94023 RepID=A0A9N8V143_9GLOM|nr:12627_t:CDS:2 [Acaulospora morrowiae]